MSKIDEMQKVLKHATDENDSPVLQSEYDRLKSLLQEAREALEMISHLEQWSLDTLDGTMERKDGGDYYLADDVDTIAQQALDRLKGAATPYSPESPLPPHL